MARAPLFVEKMTKSIVSDSIKKSLFGRVKTRKRQKKVKVPSGFTRFRTQQNEETTESSLEDATRRPPLHPADATTTLVNDSTSSRPDETTTLREEIEKSVFI